MAKIELKDYYVVNRKVIRLSDRPVSVDCVAKCDLDTLAELLVKNYPPQAHELWSTLGAHLQDHFETGYGNSTWGEFAEEGLDTL